MYLSSEKKSLFLRIENKQDLLSAWSAESFEIRLAHLVDIFRQLNTMNLELQRKGSLIIDLVDKIKAFIRKMENWRGKVAMGNLAMLETVSKIVVGVWPLKAMVVAVNYDSL